MADTTAEHHLLYPGKDHRSFFEIWVSAVPMVAISLTTIVANGAILTMFLSRRGLRRCKNVYLASLALADFLVGLTMPYKMTRDLHRSWDSGLGCRLYQTLRQSLMYVSFLSIFLITVDKWRAIHYPVSYRNKQTKRIAVAAVVMVWVISFFIFSVPQIWWEDFILSRASDLSQTRMVAVENGVNARPEKIGISNLNRNSSTSGSSSSSSSSSGNSNSGKAQNLSLNVRYRINSGHERNRYGICPEGYHLGFNISVFSTTLFYVIPILTMLILDTSLYLKIKWRKSVEVQRSTSVTDTYFMTLKKPALELESCVNSGGDDDAAKESLLKNSDNKPINKHLAIGGARGERRHSSLPAISPIIKGRTSSGRRVSMPEGNTGGGCRYVGRKWSGCSTAFGNNQNQNPNPMANLAPRIHNEDMVHDILVKQDRKAARCLCLMLLTLVVCWLPHAVVSSVNARCWCLHGGPIIATGWIFMLDHTVNPFLYGLMNAQFKNVLKQWLLIERVHAFKMRDTLILKNLQKKVVCEENNKDKSPVPQTKSGHDIIEVVATTDSDHTPL
ncbi:uncharacterized protein LOC101858241 [Aplysia californica]|uniref:Uncharacterized protein LOC101858241 n=1 Tax=Aplysia californica TaxID=6500 RepID=A0ABM0KAX3_APLCA|nr:uncharacterized protein LOC101858241 [Aplysia californica]